MGESFLQKKYIESEMDRFEKEISSIGPTSMANRSFIPAQVRRPMQGGGGGLPPPPPPHVVKPSPIIISGAPQVYNANASRPSTSSESISAPPKLNDVPGFSKATPGGSSTSSGTIVKPLETLKTPSGNKSKDAKKKKKKKKRKDDDKKPKKLLRSAGGHVWEDITLQDWDPSDFRIFCGDLGNDVTDEVLTRVFGRYPSFQRAKVIRDKRSNKTKGFGFVSFKDPIDFARAMKEMDGKYVGSRPIKLRKSDWRKRNLEEARKRDKERIQLLTQFKK